jgi:hypothetical protein
MKEKKKNAIGCEPTTPKFRCSRKFGPAGNSLVQPEIWFGRLGGFLCGWKQAIIQKHSYIRNSHGPEKKEAKNL